MLNCGRRTLLLTIKRNLSRTHLPKSFDVDLVTTNYEKQTRRATITPKNGVCSSLHPLNDTGRENICHALSVTIEDVMARQRSVNALSRVIKLGMVKDAEFRFRCRTAEDFSRITPLFDGSKEGHSQKMRKLMVNNFGPLDVIDGISLKAMGERVMGSEMSEREKEKALIILRYRFPSGIPHCGPDALRFALLRSNAQAQEVPIDIVRLAEEGLRFCNKLWNLAKYAEEVRAKVKNELAEGQQGEEHVMDAWLRSRLSSTLLSVNAHMGTAATHRAFDEVYSFFRKDVSGVYVESTKKALWSDDKQRLVAVSRTLDGVLAESLRQLSVFMPFISHFLHERIIGESVYDRALQYSPSDIDLTLEDTVDEVLAAAWAARYLKRKLKVPPTTNYEGILFTSLPTASLTPLLPLLNHLGRVSIDTVLPFGEPTPDEFSNIHAPSKDARIALKVEECHRKKAYDALEEQLDTKLGYWEHVVKRFREWAVDERERAKVTGNPIFEKAALKNDRKKAQADAIWDRAEREYHRVIACLPSDYLENRRKEMDRFMAEQSARMKRENEEYERKRKQDDPLEK